MSWKNTVSCMKRYNSLLILIGFALNVHAKSLIDQIGWRGATPRIILGILLGLVFLIGTFVIIYVAKVIRQKSDSLEADSALFEENALRLNLTESEKKKLWDLLHHEKTVQPQTVFQSVSLFERCVHAEVVALQSKGIGSEELKAEDSLMGSIRRKLGYTFIPYEHPLSSSRNIAVGQVGSVFGDSMQTPVIRKAKVTDNREFSLRLEFTPDKEDAVRIGIGTHVRFAFTRQNDGVYGIPMKVVAADGRSLELEHTLDLRRNQLRQFVRIEANVPMKFRLIRTGDMEKSEVRKDEVVQSRMADIGGGGLSFLSDRALKPGDVVSLTFALPGGQFGGVPGKIVRVALQEGKTSTFYRHHVQFLSIDPGKREKIVKYVFEKQRHISQWR